MLCPSSRFHRSPGTTAKDRRARGAVRDAMRPLPASAEELIQSTADAGAATVQQYSLIGLANAQNVTDIRGADVLDVPQEDDLALVVRKVGHGVLEDAERLFPLEDILGTLEPPGSERSVPEALAPLARLPLLLRTYPLIVQR